MNTIPKTKSTSTEFLSKPLPLSSDLVNPKRDWMILIITFIIFILIVVSFDAYMYQEIVSGDMYISVNREDLFIENLKSDDLRKVISVFETKKTNVINLKLENLTDPSI